MVLHRISDIQTFAMALLMGDKHTKRSFCTHTHIHRELKQPSDSANCLKIASWHQETMATNYYDTLAIPRAASLDDIKKAYKKAALVHHPDKGGDPEEFKRVSAAVAILSDARKRREYDSTLLQARSRDGLSAVDIAAQSDKLRSTELRPQGYL